LLVMGRYVDEFFELLNALAIHLDDKSASMIIYIHNSAYEFNNLAEHFYNYLSSFVVELDPNDKEAEDWLVERTNEFVRLAFPPLCEEIGIEEEE